SVAGIPYSLSEIVNGVENSICGGRVVNGNVHTLAQQVSVLEAGIVVVEANDIAGIVDAPGEGRRRAGIVNLRVRTLCQREGGGQEEDERQGEGAVASSPASVVSSQRNIAHVSVSPEERRVGTRGSHVDGLACHRRNLLLLRHR